MPNISKGRPLFSRSRFAFPVATLPMILLAGCLVAPSVNDIQPATVNACQKIDFTGTFVNITQANLVDTNGTKIPLGLGTLCPTSIPGTFCPDPIPGQDFRVAVAMQAVPVGDYKISIDEAGGSVFFLGFVSAGSATSTKTFHVATTVDPPRLMLTATNSTGPGAPAVLTPTIAGTGTAAIFPGNLSDSSPHTVHACKTTTYALAGENQCATAQSAKATVTVAGPVIDPLYPSTVAAGATILVAGTGFNDPSYCGETEVSLTNAAAKYVLTTLNGAPATVSAAINSCVPAGTYNVVVKTSESSATSPNKLIVQPFVGTACPDDGNECTTDFCSNGACVHQPANEGVACGTSGKCNGKGICVASTTPLPAPMCVKALPPPTNPNLNECVPDTQMGNHCCTSSNSPAACINGVCFQCIAHGAACGTPGSPSSLCCTPGDACVADPVTAATTCNVPN